MVLVPMSPATSLLLRRTFGSWKIYQKEVEAGSLPFWLNLLFQSSLPSRTKSLCVAASLGS